MKEAKKSMRTIPRKVAVKVPKPTEEATTSHVKITARVDPISGVEQWEAAITQVPKDGPTPPLQYLYEETELLVRQAVHRFLANKMGQGDCHITEEQVA